MKINIKFLNIKNKTENYKTIVRVQDFKNIRKKRQSTVTTHSQNWDKISDLRIWSTLWQMVLVQLRSNSECENQSKFSSNFISFSVPVLA